MNVNEMQAAAEAMLFACGEPVEIDRIAEILEIDVENAESLVLNIAAKYDESNSGIKIVKMDKKYQICTRKEYAEQVRDILDMKKNAPLSQAAFEVLAVVAYNQPITKAYIEQVRGVDCSGVISTLCQKGLIEEVGRLELPGRPLIYGTTAEFLKCFCINSLDDLPDIPELNEKPIEEQEAEVELEKMEAEIKETADSEE
ncbi:MAG: SMC-Scp complex subunit ScpB [Ruminococcaceae bacterium]|nr:SMC-Scp complex subunit ScpB [Oscillospiraceae bacterium]